jgi:HEAT repeats
MLLKDLVFTVLIWAIAIEATLVLVGIAAVFIHALWLEQDRRRKQPLVDRALFIVRKGISGDDVEPEEAEFLRTLSFGLLVEVAGRLAPSLALQHRAALFNAAEHLGLIARAERQCRSAWWWRRLHAVRLLTLFGGGARVIPDLLRDPSPAVRAQAVAWAAEHPSPTVLLELILMLSDPKPICRFTVQDSLLRIGRPAVEPLAAYLAEADARSNRAGALGVAIGLADSRFVPPALHAIWDPLPAVRRLAAELLGAIGGSEAVVVLMRTLGDADATVRAAAVRALGRVGHWPAAGRIAELLSDRAWIVRRDAAIALRSLGPPGQMLLRRSLRSTDLFAADMARQVLDLPAASTDVLTA